MLAGAELGRTNVGDTLEAKPDWSEVVAGKWLLERLDALRSPRVRAEIDAGAGLTAELRPYQKLGVQWPPHPPPAPPVVLSGLAGSKVELNRLRGRVVKPALYFFSTR